MKTPKNILLIENNLEQALLFKELLSLSAKEQCQFIHKDTLSLGLEHLKTNTPDAILLDLNLPDSKGLETLDKVCALTSSIPVVVLSDSADKGIALEAVKRGAQDYLLKEIISGPILSRVLCYAIERQQLNNALLKQDEDLSRVLSSITDSIWSAEITEGKVVYRYYSPVVERITGYPREYFMSGLEAWTEIVHPEDKELFLSKVEQEILGEIVKHQYRIVRADGEERWISGTTSPTLGTDGTVVHLDGIVSDITERHKSTEALRQQSRQQAAVAHFGQRALVEHDLQALMDEATSLAADILNIEYTKVLKLLPDKTRLLLCSGIGWKPGLIGYRTVEVEKKSQAGYTLLTDKPVTVTDFQTEKRFAAPSLLTDHGVASGISVSIPGAEKPWGVFGTHASQPRIFTSDEIHFISSLANALGFAIAHNEATNSLKASETEHRTLFETTREGIIIADANNNITSLNPAATTMLGYSSAEELVGTSTTELYLDTEDREVVFKALIENGYVHDLELTLKKSDGTSLYGLGSAVIHKDEKGNILRTEGFFTDITKRKKSEEDLKLFSNAADQTADSVIITDTQGIITYVNHAFEEMTGYSQREVIGQRPSLLKSDKHKKQFFETLWNTILSGDPFRAQFINRRKNGELYYEFKTITPIVDEQGEITHFVSTGKDVTKSKLAEETLRKNEERYRTVADFTYDWETWIAPDGTYNYTSPSSERVTGYRPEEFEQNKKLLLTLIHPEDREKAEQHFERHFTDKKARPVEFRIINRDGEERWVEHICQPVYGAKKTWLGRRASNRDITERKRAEAMLEELNQISLALKYTFTEQHLRHLGR
jgi:PAS domain S-box-containing protein